MEKKMNCLIAQSGGPTVAINASLAGIIDMALKNDAIGTVYGAVNGINGFMERRILNLTELFSGHEDLLQMLKLSPAMYLGSCRYRLPAIDSEADDYRIIFDLFTEYNIGYFLYIGGNDSMDTVAKLSDFARSTGYNISIMGVPKTIDNDLACTDHTPGFGSAAKFIASSVLEISHDAYIYNLPSVSIIEIMGRNAGWLTAASALARNSYSKAPHLIYLPEAAFDEDKFIEDVKSLLRHRKHVVVAISEGIRDADGNYISANSDTVDHFGHVMLNGAGKYLENLVSNKIGCKVRSIELNVLQRCASHISSKTDIDEAFRLGQFALTKVLEGNSGTMVTITRISNNPYASEFSNTSIHNIANIEKSVPAEWINTAGNDVENALIDYIRPLIVGENELSYKDGLPAYMPVSHLFGTLK